MDARTAMMECFKSLGGTVRGTSKITGETMTFKPAINDKGELYVKSGKQIIGLELDSWVTWADEWFTLTGMTL